MTNFLARRLVIFVTVISTLLGLLVVTPPAFKEPSQAAQPPAPRYIFIFLADGGGIAHMELARLYSEEILHERLIIPSKIMKEGFIGFLTTHSADSLVTDSAAAATAMASGCKAKNGTLGICADGAVAESVMKLAKDKGMRTGLVTNSAIYDASPAAFAVHVSSREDYRSIVEQYLNFAPDLMLGGGRDQFLLAAHQGERSKDKRDFIALFKEKGYAYVSTKKELADVKGTKVLGLFSAQEMPFELRRDKTREPSLYEMTEATIRILQRDNPAGFVAFIEDEVIDTAAHQGDAASVVHDFIEFDRAVRAAYDFYGERRDETLLLVTSDHETGGLAVVWKNRLAKFFALGDPLSELVGRERAQDVQIFWGTSGHSNQPVPVIALGVGAERFRGYQDNTDFAKNLFALLRNRDPL
jgi:alkaline phosphatase